MSAVDRVLSALRQKLTRRPSYTGEGHVIALHELKALYFAIPKVANSSLKSVCVDLLGIQVAEGAWKPSVFNTREFDHLYDRTSVLITAEDAQQLQGYWRFGFVRNPWDRLVSTFHNKLKRNHPGTRGALRKIVRRKGIQLGEEASFSQFVHMVAEMPDGIAERHIRSQHCFLTKGDGELCVDFVGRFERLEDDFETVARHLAVDARLPHLLHSERRSYRDYYTAELRDLVGIRYREDVRLFEYEF